MTLSPMVEVPVVFFLLLRPSFVCLCLWRCESALADKMLVILQDVGSKEGQGAGPLMVISKSNCCVGACVIRLGWGSWIWIK